jgi:hypothetical protein
VPKGKEWPYGSCVDKVTKQLRWMAPTTLQKADPNDGHGGGCFRKFHYRYVLGLKPESEGAWLGVGIDCHAEIENHLLTGAQTLGRISSAVRPYLSAPDPERARLLVEYDIGGGSLERANFGVSVDYGRVPFVGYTDVIRANADLRFTALGIASDGQAINEAGDGFFDDPPGTIECKDWKFGAAKKGSERDFSSNGPELASDTQMITQGVWTLSKTPTIGAPIRLSHVYTNTKGRPEASKASILIPRENLLKRWEYIRGVVRTVADVAREHDPERVPGNKHACESFGGCPYAGAPCQIPIATGHESFFGGEATMSILDTLNIPGMQPNPAPTVQAGPTGVAATLGLDITAQMQALAAQTIAPPEPALPSVPPEFEQAIDYINAKGYGMVPLAGEAGKLYAITMMKRHPGSGFRLENTSYAGSGDLAKTAVVTDPARIIAIAREVSPLPVKPGAQQAVAQTPAAPVSSTPPPMGITSPETPASNPTLAALPIEGFAHPAAVTPNVQVPGLIASVPPAVAAQIAANTAPPAAPTNVAATASGEPPKDEPKKRTRGPNKPKTNEANKTAESSDDARWLFVNAIPNVSYEDCSRFVAEWHAGMAKHFKLATPYDDVRMAPNDHSLGYGKGLAALEAVAKNAAKHLAPGAYYINTESELARAVAHGLAAARVQNPDGTDGDPVFELIVRSVR